MHKNLNRLDGLSPLGFLFVFIDFIFVYCICPDNKFVDFVQNFLSRTVFYHKNMLMKKFHYIFYAK